MLWKRKAVKRKVATASLFLCASCDLTDSCHLHYTLGRRTVVSKSRLRCCNYNNYVELSFLLE